MLILIGRRLRFSVTIKDLLTDLNADPTELTLVLKPPQGALATYVWPTGSEIIKESVGEFYIDLTPDEVGQYYFRWFSSGAVEDAAEGAFRIDAGKGF